jgi:hypothetical protein
MFFLEKNNLTESNIIKICFIYSDDNYNKNCLDCINNLTKEECSMYNLTIDDDCNRILVSNGYGIIYAQFKNKQIIGFRCANYCLKPKTYRFLEQSIVTKKSEIYEFLINNKSVEL